MTKAPQIVYGLVVAMKKTFGSEFFAFLFPPPVLLSRGPALISIGRKLMRSVIYME